MLSTVTLAVLVAVLFAVLVPLRVTRVHIHNNISPTVELQAILDPQGSDTLELLQSRADSNSRLKLAFGLTNSFVSNDPIVRKEFLKNVGSILKIPHHEVRDKAYASCNAFFVDATPIHDYAACVQIITMRTVLDLLNADVGLLHICDIYVVARGISTLWTQSKHGTADPITLHTISTHLAHWLPNTPYGSPLDIIIPMWEALWRVVAVTLSQVYSDASMSKTFGQLFQSPVRDTFSSAAYPGHSSPKAIVSEVLRLHPPTSNIARTSADGATVKARVAAAHHEPRIWGEDAEEFDSTRFMQPNHPPIYAFGYGRLSCVASRWAPMTSAVIASAILEAMKEQGFEVSSGKEIGGRTGWEAWSIKRRT